MVWMLLSSIIKIYIYKKKKHIDDTSSVIYKSNLISGIWQDKKTILGKKV